MKKILFPILACVAMILSSCTHESATVYFVNSYKFWCGFEVYEGELTDVTGKAPILQGVAAPGKTLVKEDVKFPETCTVRFLIGESEVTEGTDVKTVMKAKPLVVETMLHGQAVVRFVINETGTYTISCSNM